MNFWFINALLVLATLLALLRPLLAKQHKTHENNPDYTMLTDRLEDLERERAAGLIGDDNYAQAQHETEIAYRAHNDDAHELKQGTPVTAAIIVVATVLATALSYLLFSDSYRMVLTQERVASITEEFTSAIAELERYLAEHPHDIKARRRLAEAKYLIGDRAAAVAEYRRLAEADAIADTDMWLNYADAMVRSNTALSAPQGVRILEALRQTLASDPDHQRALFFSGLLEFELDNPARAVNHWESLLALLPEDDAASHDELRQLIERARENIRQSNVEETTGDIERSEAGTIMVAVSLSTALQAAPGSTVFIYARAMNGPPMPLAIVRLTVADLPAKVRLGSDNAMMERLSLDSFDRVEIVARVSKRGQANPVAGDLIGTVPAVRVGESVRVEISDVVK